MLFLPWNNEEEDLIYINHEEKFELHKDLIRQKRSEYVHREANEFEKALEEHKERENEDDIEDKNIEYDQDKNEFLIYETGNHEGSNPESIRAAICAPTGKAAALIDGMTLHSFLSLPVNQCKHKLVKLDSDVSNRIGVDARLQQVMRSKEPFGEISVIVLGDFNQLRPVGDKYIFQYNNSYNALVDNPLWSLFQLFELTEIMRQKDDKIFAIALSNIAKGMMTLEDINLLKSRIVSDENSEIMRDAVRVFRSNAEVDAYNTKVLASFNTEGATANAYDFCVGDGLASIREKVLSNIKNLKTTETYGLPLEIDLKVGAKYMMTVNLDIEDGLVNGACGQLMMIDYGKLQKTNDTVPCRLWIKFNEEKTGRKARANFHNAMRSRNMDPSLTPIEPVTRQINTRSTNFKVERKQFPLVPSEAMTIYKSQGGTYEKVVVNLKKGMTRSELYVACSRATKASGLYLIGDFVPPKPPERNDAVATMFKSMRSERMLKFSLEFPEESQGERFFVMFHNVQSLNKHILDIRSDKTFLCASVISLVETWTKPTDSLEIEGFKVIHRRDCNDTRKPFGQITYLKNDLNLTSFHKPIWIRKHGILTEVHVDEIKQIRTDIPFNLEDLKIYDQSDMMVVDEEFSFDRYEIVDENEQIDIDTTYNLEDLHASDQSDMMEIDEQSSFENYEIIDSTSRKILDHFLLVLDFNNTTDTDQISSQAQIINDLIEKSPFITVHNKDQSVRLKSKTGYSVQAFDSVYARTCTTADGNCLYSSLSIINIGSEKLTHSMRLLAVNAMINNSDYFQTLCKVLQYSFEEQLKRTAMDTIWGGEVQIQVLSMALSHPIYSYIQFNGDPNSSITDPRNRGS
ncbi:unnamed protein product [Rotaria sordida]|uniref:ATP-dependent DNA helicase n=2 Tax=Rotaria sordida TaxID=392033 RepID=A0A819BUD3_9BILA|nr:unnamed protein product [Rotaria sordida]